MLVLRDPPVFPMLNKVPPVVSRIERALGRLTHLGSRCRNFRALQRSRTVFVRRRCAQRTVAVRLDIGRDVTFVSMGELLRCPWEGRTGSGALDVIFGHLLVVVCGLCVGDGVEWKG